MQNHTRVPLTGHVLLNVFRIQGHAVSFTLHDSKEKNLNKTSFKYNRLGCRLLDYRSPQTLPNCLGHGSKCIPCLVACRVILHHDGHSRVPSRTNIGNDRNLAQHIQRQVIRNGMKRV